MKQNVNESGFIAAFKGWETYKDNFSVNGLRALYEYITSLEDDTGEEYDLDVVAICCEWTEYKSVEEAYNDHHGDTSDLPESQKRTTEEQQLEWLEDNTQVIKFDGGVIIQQF